MGEIERISDELFGQHVEQFRMFTDRIAQLEASNKKLKKAIDAIYDPNCDCYLCVTFREALEE